MLPVNVYVIHRLCCLTVRFFMCQHVLLSCWGTTPRGRPELISLISCKMCFVYDYVRSNAIVYQLPCVMLLLNYCFQCLNLPWDYTILCVCVCPLWARLHYGLFLGILSGTQSKTKHLNNSWMDSHSCSTDLFCTLILLSADLANGPLLVHVKSITTAVLLSPETLHLKIGHI